MVVPVLPLSRRSVAGGAVQGVHVAAGSFSQEHRAPANVLTPGPGGVLFLAASEVVQASRFLYHVQARRGRPTSSPW